MSVMSSLRNPASMAPNSWLFSKHARLLLYASVPKHMLFPFPGMPCLISRFQKWPFIIQDPTQNVTSSMLSFPNPPKSGCSSSELPELLVCTSLEHQPHCPQIICHLLKARPKPHSSFTPRVPTLLSTDACWTNQGISRNVADALKTL